MLNTSEDMAASESESGKPWRTDSHVAGFDGTDFGYTHQVDHWSLGAMLFEMSYGLPPFYEEKVSDTFDRITKFKVSREMRRDSDGRIVIPSRCFDCRDPSDRLSAPRMNGALQTC